MMVLFLNATKNILSRESIADYINKSNVLEIQVGKLFKVEDTHLNDQLTIRETVLIMADEAGIPSSIIDDLVESYELNNLLGDFIRGIIDHTVIGEEKPIISKEAIVNLKSIANSILENHIEIVMEEEELERYIDKYIASLNNLIPERDYIIAYSYQLDMVRQILTFDVIYIYITGFLLLISISLLSWCWYYSIKALGVSMILSGVVFTVLGSLNWTIYNLIKNHVIKIEGLVKPLLDKILMICFKEGVLFTFIGIIILLLFIVINRFCLNRKQLKEKQANL